MMNIKKIVPLILILFFASTFTFVARAQFLPDVYEQVTTVNAHVHYDFDGDGMHNWWELQYGLDPLDPSDAALDNDNDGLINIARPTQCNFTAKNGDYFGLSLNKILSCEIWPISQSISHFDNTLTSLPSYGKAVVEITI